MFEALSEKFQGVLRSLRGRGKLSAADVDSALRDLRLALLEADVHFKVAKRFLESVRAKATDQEVLASLTPDQMVLRILRDEMTALLGGQETPGLASASRPPTVILLAGLQGSGKTTTTAKLARWLTARGRHPLMVSVDVHRPAAREQLRSLGQRSGLPVHHPEQAAAPVALLRSALAEARSVGRDTLLVDTAGRLHIDDELMAELAALTAEARPDEVLYVADAMTGQDAVRSAQAFHERVGVTGIVLTKLDGDARGGAALSAAAVTGCPVKFAGVGEKLEDLEVFQAERMVGRILGMGDVLGLIQRAEEAFDQHKAEEFARKLRRSEFTLADYREQMLQVRKLGSLDQVLSMVPGMSGLKQADAERGEREMRRTLAIIDSMTLAERRNHALINGSRRKRIARGSGTGVEDVNRVLKQFVRARKMMKSLGGGSKGMRRLAAQLPQFR